MRCPQCPNVRLSGFNNRELSADEFLQSVKIIERSKHVCFDGFGEALLCKNLEAITKNVPWFKDLHIHTNGILLEKRTDLLLEYAPPFHQCIVSLDSLIPSHHAMLRPGGNLTKILGSMFTLKDKREKLNQLYPYIIPNLTVTEYNFNELLAFLDLSEQLDKKLEIVLPFNPTGDPSNSILNKEASDLYKTMLPQKNSSEICDAINILLSEAAARKIEVFLQGFVFGDIHQYYLDSSSNKANKRVQDCPMTSSVSVQCDGKGMLCVWQTKPVFNWKIEGTMDPSKTARGQKVIQMIKQGQIPAECSGSCCPYVGRRKSTETIERISGNFAGGWQVY